MQGKPIKDDEGIFNQDDLDIGADPGKPSDMTDEEWQRFQDKFTSPTGFVNVEDLPPLSDEDYELYERLGLLYPDEKREKK